MRIHVLGIAQDGGVPHAGCACPRCEAAQADPSKARSASSIAVQAAAEALPVLFDCAPEFPRQMAALGRKLGLGPERRLPVSAVCITHAHVGHYLGLAFLGREAFSARNLPVICTPAMAQFLDANRPFQHLARRGEVVLNPGLPGLPVDHQGLRITPFHVQHRNEDADTVGFRIEAGGCRAVFLPDFDAYDDAVMGEVAKADVAFLDATFFAEGEIPGRTQAQLGHVLLTESMDRLKGMEGKVRFLHLNHTNPALDPESPQARQVRDRGFRIAVEGETLELPAAAR